MKILISRMMGISSITPFVVGALFSATNLFCSFGSEDPFSPDYVAPVPEDEAQRILFEADSEFFDSKAEIQAAYRASLAEAIGKADRFELFLLDFEMEEAPSKFWNWEFHLDEDEFPILPYGKKSRILKRVRLSDQQQREFVPALQMVVGIQGETDGGAMCHFPIHGVRVYSKDKLIFQSSFCWKCGNFAVKYPDDAAWVGIAGLKLYDVFNEILPVPQSEQDRFNAKYGSE